MSKSRALTRAHDTGFWDFGQHLMEPASLCIKDRNDHYEMNIATDIPRDKLNVEVDGQRLMVSGEHKEESSDDREGTHQWSYSTFSRSMLLPSDVQAEKVTAKHDVNGGLQILLPKRAEPTSWSHKIPIH